MTISYSRQVATSELGTFARLLFRWRGSIYKLLYREVIIFLVIYGLVSSIYRYALTEWQRDEFEHFALFCEETAGMIPMTFILGFFVSLIVGRWWNIFMNITYPDRLMLQVSCYLQGTDERARMCRRTIARYANLAQLLVLRDISSVVRKRFPTMQHLVDAGFMTEEDLKFYDHIQMVHHKFWVPLQWIASIVYANRKEGRIENDQNVVRIVNELMLLRTQINTLLSYDWISVPLVYTQVVTIAVYSYFVASIFARQYLDPSKKYAHHEVDMYFPLFTILQFVFYMGWLKVAESIMNPLGEDDDDFEVNYLIERNLQVGYAMADENFMKIPPVKRDMHWNVPHAGVPHTPASAGLKDNPYVPSATTTDDLFMKSSAKSEPSTPKTRHASTASMSSSTGGVILPPRLRNGFRKTSSPSRLINGPSTPTNNNNNIRAGVKYSTRIRRVFSTVGFKRDRANADEDMENHGLETRLLGGNRFGEDPSNSGQQTPVLFQFPPILHQQLQSRSASLQSSSELVGSSGRLPTIYEPGANDNNTGGGGGGGLRLLPGPKRKDNNAAAGRRDSQEQQQQRTMMMKSSQLCWRLCE